MLRYALPDFFMPSQLAATRKVRVIENLCWYWLVDIIELLGYPASRQDRPMVRQIVPFQCNHLYFPIDLLDHVLVEVDAVQPRMGRGTSMRHFVLRELGHAMPQPDVTLKVFFLASVPATRALHCRQRTPIIVTRNIIEVATQDGQRQMLWFDGVSNAMPHMFPNAQKRHTLSPKIWVNPDQIIIRNLTSCVKIRNNDIQSTFGALKRKHCYSAWPDNMLFSIRRKVSEEVEP